MVYESASRILRRRQRGSQAGQRRRAHCTSSSTADRRVAGASTKCHVRDAGQDRRPASVGRTQDTAGTHLKESRTAETTWKVSWGMETSKRTVRRGMSHMTEDTAGTHSTESWTGESSWQYVLHLEIRLLDW